MSYGAAAKPGLFDGLVLGAFVALYVALFAPVLFSGHLLAPGDGYDYFLPTFLSKLTLWDPTVGTGYPVASDPQVLSWYPPALLGRLLGSWNGFLLFPYVFCSFSMYKYGQHLTGNRLAALVSGTALGMSGFMVGRLGHVAFINGDCWIPAVLLTMERALVSTSTRYLAGASFFLAMVFFGGHPQIGLYAVLFCGARLVFLAWSRKLSWVIAARAFIVPCVLAAALFAVQLLPALELQARTARTHITLEVFSMLSLHPVEILTGLFPYLLGSIPSPVYPVPYFGWSGVEGAFHVGFFVLFLGVVALWKRVADTPFWGLASFAVLLLATDGYTPLGRLLFHVPAYNLFRGHGRWLFYVDLNAAVLAGYGVAAIAGHAWRRTQVVRLSACLLGIVGLAFTLVLLAAPALQAKAGTPVSLTGNAVRIPILIALASCGLIACWCLRPQWRLMPIAAAALLLIDQGSFARYAEWRYWMPEGSPLLTPSLKFTPYAEGAEKDQQTILAVGPGGRYGPAPFDWWRPWRWPTLSFYNPLFITRYGETLSMNPEGVLFGDKAATLMHVADLFGAGFAYIPKEGPTPVLHYGKYALPDVTTVFEIGGRADLPKSFRPFAVPAGARRILMVTVLTNSQAVEQGTPMAEAVVTFPNGRTISKLRAGIETSEWAHDCSDVLPTIKHRNAEIFSTFDAKRPGATCAAHDYLAEIPVDGAGAPGTIQFQYLNQSASLVVRHLWFVDAMDAATPAGAGAGAGAWAAFNDTRHWSLATEVAQGWIYQNQRALPRAWTVSRVAVLQPSAVLETIRSGALPDGSPFDPRSMALVETGSGLHGAQGDAGDVRFTRSTDTSVELVATASQPSWLVLRDQDYPGWRAEVDGRTVPIVTTNYVQRGVALHAGVNRVRFWYAPLWFRVGLGLTVLGALAVLWLLLRERLTDAFAEGS